MNRHQRRAHAKFRETLGNKALPHSVVGATCQWRNDTPEWLAFSLAFEPPSIGLEFAKWQHEVLLRLDIDCSSEQAVAELRSLRGQGPWPEGSPVDERLGRRIFSLVHWLETRGHLVSDEHNGVAWLIERGGKFAFVRGDHSTLRNPLEALFPDIFGTVVAGDDPQLVDHLLGRVRS